MYEKFREKGNKFYNLGEYEDSLMFYERALSIFKWLELKPEDSDDDDIKKQKTKKGKNDN